jgi:choline dehydrogenase-like flavoprotein
MQFRYLDSQDEIDSNVAMVKIARDILIQMGLTPTVDLSDDAKVLAYVLSQLGQSYHWVGACSMNKDKALGAVDSNLRVYGTDGLYVCDDSILPVVPVGNTAAPAFLIGNVLANKLLNCPPMIYGEGKCNKVVCCGQPKAKCEEYAPPVAERAVRECPCTISYGGGRCQRK